ncbi:MAG: copper ion binding protein [Acidimicrobiia bacterium]|nr:copper ion binding protein [Acidimicrobiia bacterium]
MTTVTLSVPDISCGHCKTSIEGAVGPMDGVTSAAVTIDDRTVDITYDGDTVELESIIAAIEDQGYDVAR